MTTHLNDTTPQTSNGASRRSFLGGAAAALGFAFSGAGSLEPFATHANAAVDVAEGGSKIAYGYGPLAPAGDLLALPKGFSYTVLGESGKARKDGYIHPGDPDSMGCFPAQDGSLRLVCNHELAGNDQFPVAHVEGLVYDPGAIGGTSTMVISSRTEVVNQYTSVAGTVNNCSGGVTPWGTWLSCEETEDRAGQGKLTKDHGYVFEVDPLSQAANKNKSNIPLKFLGRFPHEGAAVDPKTGQIFLTEDAGKPNGLLYRWTPPAGFTPGKGALHKLAAKGDVEVGALEAMRCLDNSGRYVDDLSRATEPKTTYRVEWVKVPDRDAREVSTRKQFKPGEVTPARKLEGMWVGDGGIYFVSSYARSGDSSTGIEHDGQVWFYNADKKTITLKVLFGKNTDPQGDHNNFDGPDNITVSPYGGLIMAEDGEGKSHLVGVTENGKAFPMALNLKNESEFTGPVFSPDGRVLFTNIQTPGFTLAVTGAWRRPAN